MDCRQRPIPAVSGVTAIPPGSLYLTGTPLIKESHSFIRGFQVLARWRCGVPKRNVLNPVRELVIELCWSPTRMNLRSLIIALLALGLLTGTSSAIERGGRQYRAKKAKVPTTGMDSKRGIRSHRPHLGSRNGPVNPYSARGYVMKPYRHSKSVRGGGRGTIRVMR